MFKLISKSKNARLGILKTSHFEVETPCFMPVATKAAAKYLSPRELIETGTQQIICNGFVLSLTPGIDVIEKAGKLHKFMGFERSIFTDSGGFQVLLPEFLVKVEERGVHFKSPFDGKTRLFRPEDSIAIQNRLSSDVAMCLDDVPHYGESKEYFEKSLKRTNRWAQRCKESHKNKKQLLFGISQGGTFPDLRKQSIEFLNKLNFDGIALGGLCIGEPKTEMYKSLDSCMHLIPEDKPRYLMGVGSPEDILESIEKGIDIFDSVFPTRNARHGDLFTSKGILKMNNSSLKTDTSKPDENCDCYVCRNFTKAYLSHLIRADEPLGKKLLTFHNVYFIQNLMKQSREAIKSNTFEKFKKEFLKIT